MTDDDGGTFTFPGVLERARVAAEQQWRRRWLKLRAELSSAIACKDRDRALRAIKQLEHHLESAPADPPMADPLDN